MVDPNRKINRLTEKDIEFLDECEEEFKDRFSTDDEDFMAHCKKEFPAPPIVDPWTNIRKNYQDGNRTGVGGEGGGGGGGGFRNNHHGRGRYNHHHHHRRGGRHFNRNKPYNRPDGSSGSQRY